MQGQTLWNVLSMVEHPLLSIWSSFIARIIGDETIRSNYRILSYSVIHIAITSLTRSGTYRQLPGVSCLLLLCECSCFTSHSDSSDASQGSFHFCLPLRLYIRGSLPSPPSFFHITPHSSLSNNLPLFTNSNSLSTFQSLQINSIILNITQHV